jgi:hypothetical protein
MVEAARTINYQRRGVVVVATLYVRQRTQLALRTLLIREQLPVLPDRCHDVLLQANRHVRTCAVCLQVKQTGIWDHVDSMM